MRLWPHQPPHPEKYRYHLGRQPTRDASPDYHLYQLWPKRARVGVRPSSPSPGARMSNSSPATGLTSTHRGLGPLRPTDGRCLILAFIPLARPSETWGAMPFMTPL